MPIENIQSKAELEAFIRQSLSRTVLPLIASQLAVGGNLEIGGTITTGGIPIRLPAGTLIPSAATDTPAGYLACDGTAVSRTTYSDLFDAIGETYGAGDGSTTFNVPDMQGRLPVGLGTHADVNALGDSDGLAAANRAVYHQHDFTTAAGDTTVTVDPAGGGLTNTVSAADHVHDGTADSSGPAYLTVNYFVKT